jgi:menaquinone-specific isochorismate synthase
LTSLRVRSYFSQAPKPIGELSSARDAMVFVRSGKSIIGYSELTRLEASGPGRLGELAAKWQQLIGAAQVQDEVALPGSGLVGFLSASFAPESGFASALIVPRRVEVIREDQRWITEISEIDGGLETASAHKSSGKPAVTASINSEFVPGTQSAEGFLSSVSTAVAAIRAGKLSKVVLARDLELAVGTEFDAAQVLKRLHQRYPQCWTYSINNHFGASPELLIRSASGEVSARVLAGTAGRGTDPDVDRAIAEGLSHSAKNLHEHQYAVESLVAKLSPFCDSVSADEKPFSLALPDLWHLASDVTGKLTTAANLLDVVTELHPTAAVAGTPRELAQQLIAELEPFDRGGYAGPVGWIAADGSGELAIALRGGRFEPEAGLVRAFAGCGIVAESEPEAELAETELKFRAMRWAFGQSQREVD